MNGSFFRLLLPLIALLLALGAASMLTAQEVELRVSESSTAKEPEGRLQLSAPLSEEENPKNLTVIVAIEFATGTAPGDTILVKPARATKPAISPKDATRPKRIRVDVPFTRPAEGSQALVIRNITLTATGDGWTKTYSKQNYSIAAYDPLKIKSAEVSITELSAPTDPEVRLELKVEYGDWKPKGAVHQEGLKFEGIFYQPKGLKLTPFFLQNALILQLQGIKRDDTDTTNISVRFKLVDQDKKELLCSTAEPFAIAPLTREDTLAVKVVSKSYWTGMCRLEVSTSLPQLRQAELDSSMIYVYDKYKITDEVFSSLKPDIDSSGRFTFPNLPYRADLFKSKALQFTLVVKPKGKASIMRSTTQPVPIPPVVPWFLLISAISTTVIAINLKPAYSSFSTWRNAKLSANRKILGGQDNSTKEDALISIEPKDVLQLKGDEKNELILRVRQGERLRGKVECIYLDTASVHRPQSYLNLGTELLFLGQGFGGKEFDLSGDEENGYVIEIGMPIAIPPKPLEMKLNFRVHRLGDDAARVKGSEMLEKIRLSCWLHFPATTVAGKPTIIGEPERPPSPVISPPALTSTPAAASFGDKKIGELLQELSRHDEPARINVNLPEGVSLEEAMLLAVVNRVLTDDSAGAKELRGLATEIGLVLSLRERTDIEAAKDNPALFPLKFKDPSGEWAFIKDSRDRLLGVPWEPGGFSSYSSRNVLRKTFKGIADDKVPSGLKMKQLWRACEFKRESDEFSVGLAKEGYLEIEGEIVPTELSRHPLPDYQTILNEVQRIEKAKEIQKNVTVALLQKLVANASSHKTEIYDVKSQLQWLHNSVATQTGALQNLIQEISQLKSPIHDRKQPSHDSKLYDRVKAIEIWSKEVATAISDLRREQGSLLDQIKVPAAGGMSASGAPQPLDATELKTQGIKIGKLQSRLERLGKDSSGGDSASISKTLESIEIKLSGIDERIRKIEDGEPDRSQEYVRAVGKLTEKFEELERKVNSATHPSDKPPETPKATPPSDWWAGCIRENVDKTNAELPYIGVLKDLQSRLSTKLPANATVGIKQLSIIGRNIVKLEEAHPNPGPDTEAKHFLVVDLKDNGNSLSVFVPPHRFKTVSYPAVFRHLIEQPSGDYSLILRPAILIERQADNVWEIVEKMQLA